MSYHRTHAAEEKIPITCISPACGLPLQAAVSFCPYCGHLQADTSVEEQPIAGTVTPQDNLLSPQGENGATSGDWSPEADSECPTVEHLLLDSTGSGEGTIPSGASTKAASRGRPALTALSPKLANEAPAAMFPNRSEESKRRGEFGDTRATGTQENTKRERSLPHWRTYLVVASVLSLLAAGWWAGISNDSKVQQCEALAAEANTAFETGELAVAAYTAQKASSICDGERLNALRLLSARVEQERFVRSKCEHAEAQAQALLERARPGQTSAMLIKARIDCGGRQTYRDLMDRSEAATKEAKSLFNKARSRLNAHAYDEADTFLNSALQEDADVAGSESLRRAIAAARAETLARQQAKRPPEPSPARVPLVEPETSGVVAALVLDGQRALQQKNYALAKAHAQSALRIDPRHRVAESLLQRANQAERAALEGINIE